MMEMSSEDEILPSWLVSKRLNTFLTSSMLVRFTDDDDVGWVVVVGFVVSVAIFGKMVLFEMWWMGVLL